MRDLLKQVPLFEALKALSKERKHSTLFMYFLLASVSCLIVGKLFFAPLQRISLEQFHLRSHSFLGWAFRQLEPSMYNFANELWFLQASSETAAPVIVHQEWFNHYPIRYVTFGLYRNIFYPQAHVGKKYIYAQSRYRGMTLQTVYEFEMTSDGLLMKPSSWKGHP